MLREVDAVTAVRCAEEGKDVLTICGNTVASLSLVLAGLRYLIEEEDLIEQEKTVQEEPEGGERKEEADESERAGHPCGMERRGEKHQGNYGDHGSIIQHCQEVHSAESGGII